jgi:hypothetical protein
MLVFYRTDRATTSTREGFRDEILITDEVSAAVGCLFSTDPFDECIRGNGSVVLFLDIPPSVFSHYARPFSNQSMTAVIPAKVANQYGPAKLLTYRSAVLLSRLIKAKRCLNSYTNPLSNLSSLTHNLLAEEEMVAANSAATF